MPFTLVPILIEKILNVKVFRVLFYILIIMIYIDKALKEFKRSLGETYPLIR